MAVVNTAKPNRKPKKGFEILNFQGRPEFDKADSSDAERQFQRELKPYGDRYFKPDRDAGYNVDYRNRMQKLNAGNVREDGKTFFHTEKETTYWTKKDGSKFLEIKDNKLYQNGKEININRLNHQLASIEERLTAGGL